MDVLNLLYMSIDKRTGILFSARCKGIIPHEMGPQGPKYYI